MATYAFETVVNTFINLGAKDDIVFSTTKMHRILYLANGIMLGHHKTFLTNEVFICLSNGPFCKQLSRRYGIESNLLYLLPKYGFIEKNTIEYKTVSKVYEMIKDKGIKELCKMTKTFDSPFALIFNQGEGLGKEIPNYLIEEFFSKYIEAAKQRYAKEYV